MRENRFDIFYTALNLIFCYQIFLKKNCEENISNNKRLAFIRLMLGKIKKLWELKTLFTFAIPTFSRVAKACLFNEERLIRSKSMILIFLTPALANAERT